jgi:hypothetical protein
VLAASRGYVLAAAAFAATSAVVVTPAASRPAHIPVRSMETRLVDVTDVPINLFDDIVNIPYNEIQGIDVFSDSLLFSGDWWVPSATNIWGTDPGDLGHYMGLLDMALPFAPQISGLDQPEIDPIADANGTAGLAQQIALLAAAELPTSASCDAQTCAPMTPPEVITGNTGYDRDIGFLEAFAGNAENSTGQPFDLFSNWLQVPLSDLTNGFTFTPADDPGLEDPSPDLGATGDVPGSLGFDGTTGVDGTGTGDFMPWAGDTFQLNLFGPFEDFYNSLFAAPTGGIDGSGVEIPTGTEILDAFQNFTAGAIVAFDPYVAGSPACPGVCDLPTDESQLGLLQNVLAWDPTNSSLSTYVGEFAANLENNATQDETNDAIALLQTGSYNFSPTELAQVDTALGNINPELPALFTNDGIITDPAYEAYTGTGPLDAVYGGYDPNLLGTDLVTLFQDGVSSPVDPTLSTDLSTLATDFSFPGDPAALAALLAGDPVSAAAGATDPTGVTADLSSVLGGFDPSALSTDLSTLLASLGTGVGSDALTQVLTDFSSQFAADLGPQLATDVATLIPSMF